MAKKQLSREREFHDQRFQQPSTRSRRVGKFYSIAEDIFDRLHWYLRNSRKNVRVLECGCGLGEGIFALGPDVSEALGIDISEVALRQAVRNTGAERMRLRFALMDAHTLGLASDTFDLVYGTGILHHLRIDDVMRELSRVITPEGEAVFIEPLGHNPLINLYRALTPNIRSADEHPLTMSDLGCLSRYFERVNLDYYYCVSLAAVPFQGRPGGEFLLRFLKKVDRHLLKVPFMERFAWMVFIRLGEPRKS